MELFGDKPRARWPRAPTAARVLRRRSSTRATSTDGDQRGPAVCAGGPDRGPVHHPDELRQGRPARVPGVPGDRLPADPPRRPARAAHRRRRRARGGRGRPDREVRTRRPNQLAGRARAATGTAPCRSRAAGLRRLRHRRRAPEEVVEVEPSYRAWGPINFRHGGHPVTDASLRGQHRGVERGALRGAPRERAEARRCRGHLHEARVTVIDGEEVRRAAPPEQAHRLRSRSRCRRACEGAHPGPARGAGAHRTTARRSTWPPTARTQGRRLRHRAARRATPSMPTTAGGADLRSPAAARPAWPSTRPAAPALRLHPLRQRHLDRRPRGPARRSRDGAPLHNPEPEVVDRAAAASSTTRGSRRATARAPAASCHVFGDKDDLILGPRQSGRPPS